MIKWVVEDLDMHKLFDRAGRDDALKVPSLTREPRRPARIIHKTVVPGACVDFQVTIGWNNALTLKVELLASEMVSSQLPPSQR